MMVLLYDFVTVSLCLIRLNMTPTMSSSMLGLRRRSPVRLGTNISIFLFSNSSSHHLSSHISLGYTNLLCLG